MTLTSCLPVLGVVASAMVQVPDLDFPGEVLLGRKGELLHVRCARGEYRIVPTSRLPTAYRGYVWNRVSETSRGWPVLTLARPGDTPGCLTLTPLPKGRWTTLSRFTPYHETEDHWDVLIDESGQARSLSFGSRRPAISISDLPGAFPSFETIPSTEAGVVAALVPAKRGSYVVAYRGARRTVYASSRKAGTLGMALGSNGTIYLLSRGRIVAERATAVSPTRRRPSE